MVQHRLLVTGSGQPWVQWDTQIDRLVYGATFGQPSGYFANPSYHNIAQEETYDLRCRLSWASDTTVTVPLTLGGTAIEGTDYSMGAMQVVFPPGETEATVTVTLYHTIFHITKERRVEIYLGNPTGNAVAGPQSQTWTMALRWLGLEMPQVIWSPNQDNVQHSKNGGTQFFTINMFNMARTDGLIYLRKTGGTAIEGEHFTWFENPIPVAGNPNPGNGGAAFAGIVPIPGNISEDLTLEFDFHFVYHPPSTTTYDLPRRNMVNWTEKFGPHEYIMRDGPPADLTPGYPTGWAYGGDHAYQATPSLESKQIEAVKDPLGRAAWFVFSSRESISPGKNGHGTLLRSFISGTCGDLSGSDSGYPGIMVPLQCRSMYWRQTEEVDERSAYIEHGIYDRTGAEWHGVELNFADTDPSVAPVLEESKRLDTVGSSWRLITDDPLCEPVVNNGWWRVEIVYESVPLHSESRISEWNQVTAYAEGDWVYPETSPDTTKAYQCIAAGTSGASEPTWPTTDLATVVDGGVTWKCHKVDSGNVANRGSCSFTTNSQDTPINMRGKGAFVWGDQIELGVSAATAYQRVPLQYYWFDFFVNPNNVPPSGFEILNS